MAQSGVTEDDIYTHDLNPIAPGRRQGGAALIGAATCSPSGVPSAETWAGLNCAGGQVVIEDVSSFTLRYEALRTRCQSRCWPSQGNPSDRSDQKVIREDQSPDHQCYRHYDQQQGDKAAKTFAKHPLGI
jgi:hypothetical protein